MPFGGYKQSGNGRDHGVFGFEKYLEVKAVLGIAAPHRTASAQRWLASRIGVTR